MFELLDPRKVAAKKMARLIAERYIAKGAPPESKGRPSVAGERAATVTASHDSVEVLLEKELKRYGLSLEPEP